VRSHPGHAVFLINLLQDVNVLRPLIYMSACDLALHAEIYVTPQFMPRDSHGTWYRELLQISHATGAVVHMLASEADAILLLQGKHGTIFAASETNLSAHAPTHNIFLGTPPAFLRVTLQHGYECVGFLQSEQHDIAHGQSVTFAADVLCGWFPKDSMTAMQESQKPKLLVTGPTALLQQGNSLPLSANNQGLVCENLHSPRMNVSGDLKTDFMEVFTEFCNALRERGEAVVLRPHPGGQYVIKAKTALPDNVTLENSPAYKVDFADYAYGISAPSSVLLDMMLAGIPVAVWRDADGVLDADHYAGLAQVSTLEEWIHFSEDAAQNPGAYLTLQQRFIEQRGIQTDPQVAYQQFGQLMLRSPLSTTKDRRRKPETLQLVYVANSILPTLQLSFMKPLADLVEAGSIEAHTLTEEELRFKFAYGIRGPKIFDHCNTAIAGAYIDRKLTAISPDLIVFCRYSGPQATLIRLWAKQRNIPVIYHIDDDLLQIPPVLGAIKFRFHNEAMRVKTVRYLLDNVDLVYCSTPKLLKRFENLGVRSKMVSGEVYCTGDIITVAELRPVTTIGYMGQRDHAHNLEITVPVLTKFLRTNPQINFELFGSIAKPDALNEFGNRIIVVPPVTNYNEFLTEFAKRRWDIGICPLEHVPFNMVKANTKWVEYTMVGAAVVATKDTVYDACGGGGCACLVEGESEWLAALQNLVENPRERFEQVRRAQAKIEQEYSVESLRKQIINVFDMATNSVSSGNRLTDNTAN
jgi:glycosyltransferase involved in cell wall biosynthesis